MTDQTSAKGKSRPPYIALYPSDYLADTAHLGLTEHGVYWRLLLHYYQHENPLSADLDRICRVVLASTPEERRTVEYILTEFFILTPEPDGTMLWRHPRADREIEAAHMRRDANVRRGKGGASGRWGNDASTMRDASVTHPSAMRDLCQPEPEPEPEPEEDYVPTGQVILAAPKRPPVPVKEILDLYHQLLPMCPSVQKLTEARRRQIEARWRSGDIPDLDSWREYFAFVAKSKFLTGMAPSSNGRKPFVADIDFLTRESSAVKIYEGKYA